MPAGLRWLTSGMAGRAYQTAKPWLKGMGLAMGIGGIAGMINPNRSVMGGIGTTSGGAISGGIKGAMWGGVLGAGVGAMSLPTLGLSKSLGMNMLSRMGSYAATGGKVGLMLGAGLGMLRAGFTSNKPVNRIKGMYY